MLHLRFYLTFFEVIRCVQAYQSVKGLSLLFLLVHASHADVHSLKMGREVDVVGKHEGVGGAGVTPPVLLGPLQAEFESSFTAWEAGALSLSITSNL